MIMKSIVVEGNFDYVVVKELFPHINESKTSFRIAQGFSSAFAMMKALVDYGNDVLAILDTDSNRPNNDNRDIMARILPNSYEARNFKIVWMDSCIEDVLERAVPGITRGINKVNSVVKQRVAQHRRVIIQLPEFQEIKEFVEG